MMLNWTPISNPDRNNRKPDSVNSGGKINKHFRTDMTLSNEAND